MALAAKEQASYLIVCRRCRKRGFQAVSERAVGKRICVACDARDGSWPIGVREDDLTPAEQTARVTGVRVVHLRARMENWDLSDELAAMEELK